MGKKPHTNDPGGVSEDSVSLAESLKAAREAYEELNLTEWDDLPNYMRRAWLEAHRRAEEEEE